jgi:SAM-dependent methyltransferase
MTTISAPALVQRIDHLSNLCRGKKVLHLGCTNWPYLAQSQQDDRFLHTVLGREAAELWGLDSDSDGLAAMRADGVERLVEGDLEALESVSIDADFDVIVAGEVIEHLSNPGLFLRGVRSHMTEKTRLVITTVNAFCAFRTAVYAFLGKGGVNEPIHVDHVSYYSYSTLHRLVSRHGLSVEKTSFYDLGREHRPHASWRVRSVNDAAVRFWPQLADGIIVECRLPHRCESDE